jgi:S1-C subfamily serine protease
VSRGYVGIAGSPRPIPPARRELHGDADVVAVGEVVPGAPADRAGVRTDDLIVALDGIRLTGVADLQRALEGDRVGTRLVLTLLRDGRERQVVVVPDELGG